MPTLMDMEVYEKALQQFSAYTKFHINQDKEFGAHRLVGGYEMVAANAIAKLAKYDKAEAEQLLSFLNTEKVND